MRPSSATDAEAPAQHCARRQRTKRARTPRRSCSSRLPQAAQLEARTRRSAARRRARARGEARGVGGDAYGRGRAQRARLADVQAKLDAANEELSERAEAREAEERSRAEKEKLKAELAERSAVSARERDGKCDVQSVCSRGGDGSVPHVPELCRGAPATSCELLPAEP